MNLKISLTLVVIAFVFSITACESVDSADIRTSGVYAKINVMANGDGNTRVKTRLTVGGVFSNTDLELEKGDQLIASASGGSSIIMREDKEFLGGVEYKATFLFDTENTRINVAFNRPSGISAPDSYVVLPAPITFVTPLAGQTFKRSDNVRLSWTPVSNNMSRLKIYSIRSRCNDASGQEISRSGNSNSILTVFDPGSVSRLASSYITAIALSDPAAICTLVFRVERTQDGVLDAAFGKGGRISANRYDEVQITVVP